MKKNKPFEYSSDKNKFLSINQIKKLIKSLDFSDTIQHPNNRKRID